MMGMIVSALTGLAVLLMGLLVIRLTPPPKDRPPSELDQLRARNAELERRIAALEATAMANGGKIVA